MPVCAFRRSDRLAEVSRELGQSRPCIIDKPLGDMLQIMAANAPHLIVHVEEYVIDLLNEAGPPQWWLL